ncbi:MAG: S-layer homology domain-containing protein, partial [Clostridiales bacterium]|nr:S-layer homology domain-containing protein [Clostridiales bacterium]
FDSEGANTGGIYDPGSGTFMAKIEKSGVFNVALNEKDFSDIKKEHSQVQKAIKALASKGVINGRTPTEYEPSDKITRAEVATLFVLALKKLNANADGGFIDVKKSDWFFGAAGSSKNQSLIAGYEDNTFRGNTNIPKAQIISISGRVLANEMGYTPPPEDEEYPYKFKDDSEIPDWAIGDIYLAEFAGIVSHRVDGLFDSYEEMTRGNVAVLIWNLYQRIW